MSWLAATGPARGLARVYVDGALVGTVDLNAASDGYRKVVIAKSWSVSGTHTIRIASLGTAGHPRVDLDAFIVVR